MLALWKGNLAASYLYVTYSAAQFYAFEGALRLLRAGRGGGPRPLSPMSPQLETLLAGGRDIACCMTLA